MRQLLWAVVIVMVVAVIAFNAGRRVPTESATAPAEESRTFGGRVPEDSLRARRSTALRHAAEQDSYLPYMLTHGDSVLKRWTERLARPLDVYLPAGDVPGSSEQLAEAARGAFGRWERVADIPIRFRFVRDSASADVRVKWIEQFPMRRTGQADLVWRADGWLQSGTLTLATHTHQGSQLSADAVYTVALHEIGHLLGLDHSDDPSDVMYPSTSIHDITPRDRRTARLLYNLPPGSYKADTVTR